MKIVTLQFSPRTDHITEDGTELTQRPYPFHVDVIGLIQRRDFWNGKPLNLVGFVGDPHRHEVDLWWGQIWADPSLAVGKYAVTTDIDGGFGTYLYAVETATVAEV